MEYWITIHTFVNEHDWVKGLIIYLLCEIAKRIWPSKNQDTIAAVIGKGVSYVFDKSRVPDVVKIKDAEGKTEWVNVNKKPEVK